MEIIVLLIIVIFTIYNVVVKILRIPRIRIYSGSHDQRKSKRLTFTADTKNMGPERWRKALAGWQELDPHKPHKYIDLIFMDGKGGYRNKLFYKTKSTLKFRLDSDAVTDKAILHRILMKEAPHTVAKTFEVTDKTVLPDGAWMIRSNWGSVGSKSVPVNNNDDLKKLYDMWHSDKETILASEYIINPMLYKGRKFHLRIYVILAVYEDLTRKAWWVNDGLLIPALKQYSANDWSDKEIHDSHGHNNPEIVEFPRDAPEFAHLAKDVTGVLTDALAALLPRVNGFPESKNGCELYGADIMFWDDGRPVIIEINGAPAIGHNSAYSLDSIMNGYLATSVSDVFGKMGNPAGVTHLITINPKSAEYTGATELTAVVRPETTPMSHVRDVLKDWTILETIPEYADFVYADGTEYQTSAINIRAKLRCRIDGRALFDKTILHKILGRHAPETICKTIHVNQKTKIPPDTVWIVRANWGWGGSANQVIDNNVDLQSAFLRLTKKPPGTKTKTDAVVIASEYIQKPMLFKGYKFHLRIYVIILIGPDSYNAWVSNSGRIFPAAEKYINSDYSNARIHDTHAKSNPDLLGKYPEDLPEVSHDRVLHIFTRAVSAMQKNIKKYDEMEYGYDLYGVDMMFLSDGTPKIIEFNRFPAVNETVNFFDLVIASAFSEVFGARGSPDLVSKII